MVSDIRVHAGVGAPAVVVLPGGPGLPPDVRSVCEALAQAGLTALAVDLRGVGVQPPDHAPGDAAAGTRVAAAVRDLRRSGVLAPRVSALGYGAGGELALTLAGAGLFDSVVAYVDASVVDEDLPCPLLVHRAEDSVGFGEAAAWHATVTFLGGATPLSPPTRT